MAMNVTNHLGVFDQVFDVVVVGSGYAGFAAALQCEAAGQSVLLIGPRGDLVWESGRSFHPAAGQSDQPAWQRFITDLHAREATTAGAVDADGLWLDGSSAEALATHWLAQRAIHVLYYAQPVAVEMSSQSSPGSIASLILATKSGLRRVAGRQWIDATETGQLIRMANPTATTRQADKLAIHLYLQHADWAGVAAPAELTSTRWVTERVLSVTWQPEEASPDGLWRSRIVGALEGLRKQVGPEALGQVSMTHLSSEPLPLYDEVPGTADKASDLAMLPANVASASPAFDRAPRTTLAHRFELGAAAAASLADRAIHETIAGTLEQPLPALTPCRTVQAQVAVAGMGTGGVMAAIAASQAGVSVVGIEPMTFVGGIGTGGGIHSYYYGIVGGLQEKIDQATRAMMSRFKHNGGQGPLGDGPFNPWAKAIALEALLVEQNVRWHTDAMVFDVEHHDGRITAALVATPDGVMRVEAQGWIDGTGDGDLCALAGAAFTCGREGDGLLHAYSQSGGKVRVREDGRPRMAGINFDAGFCNPTDSQDLTRARMIAVGFYLLDRYEPTNRHSYIAPAIGLRQGRQIVTEYTLTLNDLIGRSRFDDVIGYTGGHYDSHTTDYEFESDESRFWVWINRGWYEQFACEMSYRILVPRGLRNVWIASRCLGVTQDAHYACRMQRDLQRAGEAAGFAAAEGVKQRVDAQALPYPSLRRWLDQTGALDRRPRQFDKEFGTIAQDQWLDPTHWQQLASTALNELDQAKSGQATWWLYRQGKSMRDQVAQRLDHENPQVSWLAAGLLAMWGDDAAEVRLLQAIKTLEFGPGELTEAFLNSTPFRRMAPHWLAAVSLLPLCGTSACLPVLEALLNRRPVHGINTLTTIGLALGRLANRLEADHTPAVRAMLDKLATLPYVGQVANPQRTVGRLAQQAIRGDYDDQASRATAVTPSGDALVGHAQEDNTWQLHLAIARAHAAWGLEEYAPARAYLNDPRELVRRAVAQALQAHPSQAVAAQS